MLKTGMRIVFIVDDNLIGNKKAIKAVLQRVVAWQQKQGYPLTFFTEASIDLADDAELMDLMVEANFVAMFIGIESPSEESLRETKKFQNVRAGGTLLEKVHRIQNAGMEVWCGMIMGFDSDDESDLQPADRVHPAGSHLVLDERHAAARSPRRRCTPGWPPEGRLDLADRPEFGTNVIPLRMSREELREGYLTVLKELYDPVAYFERTEELFLDPTWDVGSMRSPYWKQHPIRRLRMEGLFFAAAWVLYRRL